MSADAERRSRLLSLKLRALVRDHHGGDDDAEEQPEVFALGALLVSRGAVWALVEDDPARSLGAVIARGLRHDLPLHLLVEKDSGVLARRAALCGVDVTVWHIDERRLLPAIPEPHLPVVAPRDDHLAFGSVIAGAGADVVVEHGVVAGEVRGLEICRVVDDPVSGVARLEVGMGAHDREAFAMVHGTEPDGEALARVVDAVAVHRRVGADPHPFNRFGAERMLRWSTMQDPATVGFSAFEPTEPPVARTNVKDAVPCVASGHRTDGSPGCAVFVHGVDLDVVPFAVDAADRMGCGEVTVVMRRRDRVSSHEVMAMRASLAVHFALLDH